MVRRAPAGSRRIGVIPGLGRGISGVGEKGQSIEEGLLQLFQRKDYVPLNIRELLHALSLPPGDEPVLQQVIGRLEQTGQIARIKHNRYVRSSDADLVSGRIRITRGGRGFLQPDDPGLKEIGVPENRLSTAMHEDRVLVRRDASLRNRLHQDELTGSVIRVLERKRQRLVGTLQRTKQFLYVIPDDPRLRHDIYVPEPHDVGRPARLGDKVVVELREWESPHTNPEGEIIEVLGAPDEEGVDMLSVLRHYDLPLHFPKPALLEARGFGTHLKPEDLKDRVDCRNHLVVTIDPDDAKDFDDAICLQRAAGDRWKLWVHIADVSHYVRPRAALDDEARRRGNSTYLVDRVIPMLPEALSNELCSLKPNVERLTKCVEFDLSNDGRVLQSRFYSAVILSKRRLSYQEALAILQRKPNDPIERMLHQANEMAQRIRRLRFKAGSLDLDFPESKIRLDEQGRVLRIERTYNDISHQLIEEYMLLANEAVARRLMSEHRSAVYRVHEEPDQGRLQEFREEVISHNIPCGDLRRRVEVQKLLERLNKISIGPALKIGFLKSLMRARYAIEPLGHYGLAKKHYTHFTSPIRRYADLLVHRALFEKNALPARALREAADHISGTERNSADAERDSKDVKLYAFLKAQLKSGKPTAYRALITDVRNFGFFVDVPDLAMSGLVPLSGLDDDFYVFDLNRAAIIGRRRRKAFRLGDTISVQVARVDSFKKQVDFRVASMAQSGRREEETQGRRDGNQKKAASSSQAAGRKPKKFQDRGGFKRRRS
jgi:ribonuclease R